jgi:UPF0271 protein
MPSIDLNSDLGESTDPDRIALDLELLTLISSANIACTGHAGDDLTMTRMVTSAIKHGIAIGAHPSYPDRANFGRAEMGLPPAALERSLRAQIAALADIARAHSAPIAHIKPHGALYHAAMTRPAIAALIARAADPAPNAALVGQPNTRASETWRSLGRTVFAEAFADRRYEPDGSLRARSHSDALITDPTAAAAQALRIAHGRGVIASDGSHIPLAADTICLHSDTPNALPIARAIRTALEHAGFTIKPPSHTPMSE